VFCDVLDAIAGVTSSTSAAAAGGPVDSISDVASFSGVHAGREESQHVVQLDGSVSDLTFLLTYYGGAGDLSFTVERPDSTPLSSGDPGVLYAAPAEAFDGYINETYIVTSPLPGMWTLKVNGPPVSSPGVPYGASVFASSSIDVGLRVTPTLADIGAGAMVSMTIEEDDAPVADATAQATVVLPDDTDIILMLNDNGTDGDPAAGDGVFTAAFGGTGQCGVYEIEGVAQGIIATGSFERRNTALIERVVSGDGGGDPCLGDDDGDGCLDVFELGSNVSQGGIRNPADTFDFYDVTGDAAIDLQDALAILDRFGAQLGQAAYDPLFDRYAPDGAKPWRTAAAVGVHVGIDLQDALVNLQSFGHNCAAAP
jgi:hypothetical protein